MPYVEFKSRPDLAHIVKCVWNYDAAADDTAERPERIVPDGNPELVIHYGDPFAEIAPDGGKRLQPRAFVMGQITRPLALDACHGVAGVLGVRFHPAGVRALIGAVMDEFPNGRIEVSNFAASRAKGLVDEIASAADAPARAEIIQNFVTDRAARSTRYQDTDVDRWAARIACANGRLTVTELAGETSLSTRQLERRFRTQVGIAPRDYANIIQNLFGAPPVGLSALSGLGGMTVDLTRGIVDHFFFSILYIVLVYMIGTGCFKLIDLVPDGIMRWSGAGVQAMGASDISDDLIDNWQWELPTRFIGMTGEIKDGIKEMFYEAPSKIGEAKRKEAAVKAAKEKQAAPKEKFENQQGDASE